MGAPERVELAAWVRPSVGQSLTKMAAATLAATIALTSSTPARAQCVDEELKKELVGSRHYRGVQKRLFIKRFRHELSGMAGIYAADLYSASWAAGGAYSFHFSEDLALEASMQFTRFRSGVTESYERRYPQVQIQERIDSPGRLYFGHLVWSFAYGKLRWMGGGITRFDLNAALGAGVTDSSTATGLTGSFGLGTKWYFGSWFAIRLDVRDRILREVLVGEEHLVNDIVVTVGPSVFFPFSG